MKKLLLIIPFLLVACGEEKKPQQQAHDFFVQYCKKDRKPEGFDCNCQADIIDFELSDNEMITFVNYLTLTQQDPTQAKQLASGDEFKAVKTKIEKLAPKIKSECLK